MSTQCQKLVKQFYSICHQNTQLQPDIQAYLKLKTTQISETGHSTNPVDLNCKEELKEAITFLKNNDAAKLKITILCEQLIFQFQKVIKKKDQQLQFINNEIQTVRSLYQEEKRQNSKQQKEYQATIKREQQKRIEALEKIEYKEYQIRQLEGKIIECEEEIQEFKSAEYQNMINSIKQEEILNSEAQNMYKENTLLKHQLKEKNLTNAQLTRQIKLLSQQIQEWNQKYNIAKSYIDNKILKRQCMKITPIASNTKNQQQQPNNFIEFKEDFSFKDSIQNDNNTTIVHNNIDSFLDLQFNQSQLYQAQDSPQRGLIEREVLHLTDRQGSTYSKNITKHMLRSKINHITDKQNISVNNWEYNDFEHYNHTKNPKISSFGSKRQSNLKKDLPSNCSIDKYAPSPRLFGTQQKSSLLSKHRRIKSSFLCKSIHEFHDYDNDHFFVNSEKLKESILQDFNQQDHIMQESHSKNEAEDQSVLMSYDVNEIVINQNLISSKRPKITNAAEDKKISMIDAKMINSVHVTAATDHDQSRCFSVPVDPYYAFFSLLAQCVKLNAKNFNRMISVYFNLEEEYKNVVNKMIPINKWYNYISDQLETSLKYAM